MAKAWQLGLLVLAAVAPPAFAQGAAPCAANGSASSQSSACPRAQSVTRALYRCISPTGAVSIQNAACAPGHRTSWVRGTSPEIMTEARRQRLAQDARQRDANSRYLSRLAGTDGASPPPTYFSPPSQSTSKAARCQAAKNYREGVLKQVGLARTFNLLRSLNDQVYEACK